MRHVYFVANLVVRPRVDVGGYELLLGRRSAGKYLGETWQLISGGLEEGETAWEAALREIYEETGLRPVELFRLSTLTQFYRPDNDSLNIAPMFCAFVRAEAQVALNDEHTEFQWVDVERADEALMWPGDRKALEEVQRVLIGNGKAKSFMRIPIELDNGV